MPDFADRARWAGAPDTGPSRSDRAQSQAIWMQEKPGGVQIPQLALQQTVPAPQVTSPQGCPAFGTHTGSPSTTTH